MSEKIWMPRCWICMDEGIILYQKQIGNAKAEYASHCTCKTGEAFNYDGTKCEKHKSPYYIPVITQVMGPEQLAIENFRKWWEVNKNKEGIKNVMLERGIPIPKEEEVDEKQYNYQRA